MVHTQQSQTTFGYMFEQFEVLFTLAADGKYPDDNIATIRRASGTSQGIL